MKVLGIYSLMVLLWGGFAEDAVVDQIESSLVKKLTAVCGKDGIKVNVRFTHPFTGIVYSDGHYDTPQCVFINQENSSRLIQETRFSFVIPADECGTVFHDPGSSLSSQYDNETKSPSNELGLPGKANEVFMENTVMFQGNPFIQEQGDIAQILRCVWQKEIRRPLQATLPLTGKQRHHQYQVSPQKINRTTLVAARDRANNTYRYSPPHYSQQQQHHQQYHRHHPNFRKRFQQMGQVESVSFRRTGKSLEFPGTPAILTTESTTTRILSNMTALAYKAEEEHVTIRAMASKKHVTLLLIFLQAFVSIAVT